MKRKCSEQYRGHGWGEGWTGVWEMGYLSPVTHGEEREGVRDVEVVSFYSYNLSLDIRILFNFL